MALQTSGQISLNDVNVELGFSGTAQILMGSADVRGLFGIASGEIEMADGYGASSAFIPTSATAINGQSNLLQITVSSYISSGGIFQIPSNFWIWSDTTATPALLIDIPCTIENYGNVIGRGGNNGQVGGNAIKINNGLSGVIIKNFSGAYIAGGGSGGAGQGGGGGGGAGGGGAGGTGGQLNAVGNNGYPNGRGNGTGYGGGAGGGGGGTEGTPFVIQYGAAGGGGGRILPGVGGGAAYAQCTGGTGGSAGNAGLVGGDIGGAIHAGGGGGGWGAQGGPIGGGYPVPAPAAGKAVFDGGVTYTLTNSGTIYGGT
jgi:hypothetical protein